MGTADGNAVDPTSTTGVELVWHIQTLDYQHKVWLNCSLFWPGTVHLHSKGMELGKNIDF